MCDFVFVNVYYFQSRQHHYSIYTFMRRKFNIYTSKALLNTKPFFFLTDSVRKMGDGN